MGNIENKAILSTRYLGALRISELIQPCNQGDRLQADSDQVESAKGKKDWCIQSLWGHSHCKMTKIYTHIKTEGFNQIISPLDKLDI